MYKDTIHLGSDTQRSAGRTIEAVHANNNAPNTKKLQSLKYYELPRRVLTFACISM